MVKRLRLSITTSLFRLAMPAIIYGIGAKSFFALSYGVVGHAHGFSTGVAKGHGYDGMANPHDVL